MVYATPSMASTLSLPPLNHLSFSRFSRPHLEKTPSRFDTTNLTCSVFGCLVADIVFVVIAQHGGISMTYLTRQESLCGAMALRQSKP